MDDLAKETKKRLMSARAHKALVVRDLQEAYFFIRPRMSRQVTSDSAVSRNVSDDADMLATGIGAEVAEDFATEMIAAFFPPHAPWASSEISLMPDTSDLASVEEDVATYDKGVFSAIRRSNFNAEISVALDPDGALGTIALMISAPGAARPYRVEHVPLRELEISLGPDGEVDGRFRVRHVKASELTALLGADVVIPPKFLQPGNASKSVECAWGWWRDWSKPADDIFRHVLTLDGQVVVDESMTGTGSVPLVVMVFAPDRLHAFGNGPAIKCLQEFRVLDVFTEATQDSAIFAIKKPFLYPDDGVIDFEGGLPSALHNKVLQ